jgi:hypothetical protein
MHSLSGKAEGEPDKQCRFAPAGCVLSKMEKEVGVV